MNSRNHQDRSEQAGLLCFQAEKLQTLINELVKCCEDRQTYETQRFGLPCSEARCLLLFKDERYLTVKCLARRMGLAKSRVTKLISGLLDKKLVERISDPQDTRYKLICLTRAGQDRLLEIESFQQQLFTDLLSRLSPEDRDHALFHLEKIRDSMEAVKRTLE